MEFLQRRYDVHHNLLLKRENLIFLFADWLGLMIPQMFRHLPQGTNHRRWTAEQNLYVW